MNQDNIPESWKPFPLDRVFLVSNKGKFYNIFSGRICNQSLDRYGYYYVSVASKKKIKAHRAVLMTFDRLPNPGEEGSHLNNNRRDNRIENLKWETRQENSNRRYEHGTICHGEKGGLAKLTNAQVLEIRKLRKEGRTLVSLAKEFFVSHCLISAICLRKIWKHI